MKSFIPTRIAELLYALIIAFFGVAHFMNTEAMSGMIPTFMPADPTIWVYITGAALIAAALAIIINKFKTLACYLLAVMLIIIALTVHMDAAQAGNPGQVLKDCAMAMAAIMIGNNTSK